MPFKLIRQFFKHPLWYFFTLCYILILCLAFFSMLTVIDEYEGGKPVMEFWASLFTYFEFPLFTIWSAFGGWYSSSFAWLMWIALSINLVLNYLLTILVFMLVGKGIRKIFTRS
jgi:hypothetical protein